MYVYLCRLQCSITCSLWRQGSLLYILEGSINLIVILYIFKCKYEYKEYHDEAILHRVTLYWIYTASRCLWIRVTFLQVLNLLSCPWDVCPCHHSVACPPIWRVAVNILPYFSDHKTHFFSPEKCDLNSTCVLYAEGKHRISDHKTHLFLKNVT